MDLKNILILLLIIAVILGLLSVFGIIDLRGINDWFYNLFYRYMN